MNLPAGLIDHNYEFFSDGGVHAYCLTHGHVMPINDFPEDLLSTIEQQIPEVKAEGIRQMGISGNVEIVEQFLICNYSRFDNRPDMIDGILQEPEYWPCPHRGSCPQDGIVCCRLKTDTGQYLTDREIQVIKLSATGHLDKEIADKLEIMPNTVSVHQRNIRRKTGLQRKPDLSRFAHQKNLIQS